MMNKCKCGSFALNISPETRLCDVCYWKDKHDRLKEQLATLGEVSQGFLGDWEKSQLRRLELKKELLTLKQKVRELATGKIAPTNPYPDSALYLKVAEKWEVHDACVRQYMKLLSALLEGEI